MSKLIVANWKSNKNLAEAESWCESYRQSPATKNTVVIAPPFTLIAPLSQLVAEFDDLKLGVQDLSPFSAGSYTGAISARNLVGYDVEYVILGHSERRQHFGETHQEVANKIALAVEANLTPVVCVDAEYLADQGRAIENSLLEKCVVAYEPSEAIGSGESADPVEAAEMIQRIRAVFGDVRVLYGGSVTADNVGDFTKHFDGVIVGGKSLDASELMALAQRA